MNRASVETVVSALKAITVQITPITNNTIPIVFTLYYSIVGSTLTRGLDQLTLMTSWVQCQKIVDSATIPVVTIHLLTATFEACYIEI